jgi:hypothetical protein
MNERGGLRMLADVITALIHHALTDQDVSQQVIQWFDQGATTGCSYLALFIDYDSDPLNGNLEIVKLSEFEVLVDPTCKVYDLSKPKVGAKFIIWQSEVHCDYVEKRWPEALEQYNAGERRDGRGADGWFDSTINFLQGGVRSFTRAVSHFLGLSEEQERLRYPLLHTWWIEYRKVWYFYDSRRDDLDPMILLRSKQVQAAKDAAELWPDQLLIRETIAPQINHTITLGAEVLCEHIEDEFDAVQAGQALYPVVRFSPNFNNGYVSGLAEDMIGLQEYTNLVFSLGVNLMKNQSNSGWFIKSDAGNSKKWLEDHGNEDNVVINLSEFGGEVEKIEPSRMPDFIPMATMGLDLMRQASNIRTEQQERDQKDLSGRAILAKQQGSITGVSPSFSNFDYSIALFGKVLAHVIRACPVYSDAEIKEIIEEDKLIDPQLLEECRAAVWMMVAPKGPDGRPVPFPDKPQPPDMMMAASLPPDKVKTSTEAYTREMAAYDQFIAAVDAQAKPMAIKAMIDAVRNPRRGRYNCRVALSPQALTVRERTLREIVEINQMLVETGYKPLSDEYVLENSDLPNIEEELARRGKK